MTNKASRPNREIVHQAILKSAREIAAKDGWQAVTVRKVADSIGYTAPIIYDHFGGKDELLTAILKDAHEYLFVLLTAAANQETSSGKRLTAIATAYWQFSRERPELYRLMHGMESRCCTALVLQDFAKPTIAFLGTELMHFNPSKITSDNADAYVVEVWSMMHGLIALSLSGYVSKYVDEERVLKMVLNDLLRILGPERASTPGLA